MLPTPDVTVPPRKQLGIAEATARAHLIRIGQRSGNMISILRQQVRMPFGDMALPLWCQIDLALQVRAREDTHCHPSFNMCCYVLSPKAPNVGVHPRRLRRASDAAGVGQRRVSQRVQSLKALILVPCREVACPVYERHHDHSRLLHPIHEPIPEYEDPASVRVVQFRNEPGWRRLRPEMATVPAPPVQRQAPRLPERYLTPGSPPARRRVVAPPLCRPLAPRLLAAACAAYTMPGEICAPANFGRPRPEPGIRHDNEQSYREGRAMPLAPQPDSYLSSGLPLLSVASPVS